MTHLLERCFVLALAAMLVSCGGGGGGGASSATVRPPSISAISSSGAAGIGSTISYSASATDPAGLALTYTWRFSDGMESDTGSTVYRVYGAAGTQSATLTVSNSGGASASASTSVTVTNAVNLGVSADCSGTNCAASTSGSVNTYSALGGTGTWRFDNLSNTAVQRNIDIQAATAGGLGGKTVSLVFTNTSSSSNSNSVPAVGTLASPVLEPLATPAVRSILAQNQGTSHRDTDHYSILAQNRALATSVRALPKRTAASTDVRAMAGAGLGATVRPASVNDTKSWVETGYSKTAVATTAKAECTSAAFGRQVVFWVQTARYLSSGASATTGTVDDSMLAAYKLRFCGTSGGSYNDGQYPTIASKLGDVWGATPSSSSYVGYAIPETSGGVRQPINVVFLDPSSLSGGGSGWGGYFHGLNNLLKTTSSSSANSNEALLFFVNSRQSVNYIQTVLIHELTHMINFYQRGVKNDDDHDTWLEETSAMMTQDLFHPSGETITSSSGACLPMVCDLRSYAISGAGTNYFKWPTNTVSNTHYYIGGGFAAYLNRRFGPVIALQLMTDCYTSTTNVSSVACLDFLIKRQDSSSSFATEYMRYGASVFGRMGDVTPTGFGFPAKAGTQSATGNMGSSWTYSLPGFTNWWTTPAVLTIPSATSLSTYTYTTHTYKIDTVAAGKTSYVRTGVSVPAKSSLIVVVQ